MDANSIYRGLLNRGYAPVQAAAISGNVLQESGGNPGALNAKEGAHGLLQWRLDRWQGLQDFANSRGTSPNDPNTQLDYIGAELGGAEKKSAAPFFAAQDLASANAALKSYIRYGDDSQATRLANAQGFLKDGAAAAMAPMSIAGPAAAGGEPSAAPVASQPAPTATQPAAVPGATLAGPAGPSITPQQIEQLAAVPQGQSILPARKIYAVRGAPFSLGGGYV